MAQQSLPADDGVDVDAMKQYLIEDMLGGGWIGLHLFVLTALAWVIAVVSLRRRNHVMAAAMIEIIWLIALLRTCLNTLYNAGGCFTDMAGWVRCLVIAFTAPLMDATVLSLTIFMPLHILRRFKPLPCNCLGGLAAGLGSLMVIAYLMVCVVTWHPYTP